LLAEGIDIAMGRQIIRVSHSTITEPCPDFDENVVDASFFTPIMPEHCGRMIRCRHRWLARPIVVLNEEAGWLANILRHPFLQRSGMKGVVGARLRRGRRLWRLVYVGDGDDVSSLSPPLDQPYKRAPRQTIGVRLARHETTKICSVVKHGGDLPPQASPLACAALRLG
jgi:hypothetical protein